MTNMKLKPILLLSAFMLVLVACGGEDETGLDSMSTPIPTDTPDLNATIEAKVQSLEQDIAALKEQVAQAQAVNKELEGNIANLAAGYDATIASALDEIKRTEDKYEATIAELRDAIKTAERNIYTLTLEKEALIKELAAASQ